MVFTVSFSNLSDIAKRNCFYFLVVAYQSVPKNLTITDGDHAESATYVAVAGEEPTEVTRNPCDSLFFDQNPTR